MAAQAARLARMFTPEYACRINAQLVHPAQSQLVKPNELESALARHPFLDGNKRTAFFIANQYLRAQGLPELVYQGMNGSLVDVADRHIDAAAGRLEVEEFAEGLEHSQNPKT
ncbi:hypothetical protein DENSPDRAFT_861741 [Dentipellis sp. KUC8613]|nr:hypothetical protein DENSPDRAFT_861741 [Dentipellis sp. KUC8613]